MGFSLPFIKKQPEKDYYFGLYLTDEGAVGFVFEIKETKAVILAKELIKYSNGWDGILEDIDKMISILEAETDVHLEQTIFFIHSYMVDEETGKINNPYKDIMKSVTKELELKPLGYIEIHEAVKEYLQQRDQSPLNMVLLEIDSEHVGVYVYKGAKLTLAHHTERTSKLAENVTDILNTRHSHALLPSKVMVYGFGKVDDETKELTKHQWDEGMFIQHPRFEVFEGSDLYEALGDIFALQMSEPEAVEQMPQEQEEVVAEPVVEEKPHHKEPEKEVEDEEPLFPPKEHAPLHDNEVEEKAVMGFLVGQDVVESDIEPPQDEIIEPPRRSQKASFAMPALPAFGGDFLSQIKMPNIPLKGMKIGWIIGLVAIIAALVAAEYFLHKAEVVVYLPSEEVTKTVEITAPINENSKELAVIPHSISSEFTDQKATTGTREVGEKAKGEVNMLNFDNKEKTFTKGTKLQTGNLAFTLDQDVRVASASGVNSSGAKQAGKAKVAATAVALGPESNIDKGKELKIADMSDALYLSVVETAFRGGTRKQIQTVAKKDLDTLQESIEEKAEEDSAQKVNAETQGDQTLIKDLTTVDSSDIEFSKEVGEEADTVTVKATVNIDYYTVSPAQLKKSLISELKPEVRSGYRIEPTKISYEVEKAEKDEDDESVELVIKAKGEAVKDIDKASIVGKIKGKSVAAAGEAAENNFQSTGIEVKKMSPPIPFWNNLMPFFSNNITVSISAQ